MGARHTWPVRHWCLCARTLAWSGCVFDIGEVRGGLWDATTIPFKRLSIQDAVSRVAAPLGL